MTITQGKKKGKIALEYYDQEDLEGSCRPSPPWTPERSGENHEPGRSTQDPAGGGDAPAHPPAPPDKPKSKSRPVKVYLTVNTLLKQEELPALYEYIQPFYEIGGDALIIQDLGVFFLCPGTISRYRNPLQYTNEYYIPVWRRIYETAGATRVVTARDVSS